MDYLCLLDESESDAGAPDGFFVFGGALIPIARVKQLHDGIMRIRQSAQLPPDVALKWNMGRVPGVTKPTIDAAKALVPPLATKCNVELFVSPVLREICLEKKRVGDAYTYGANSIF
jgi:hypothetical protein